MYKHVTYRRGKDKVLALQVNFLPQLQLLCCERYGENFHKAVFPVSLSQTSPDVMKAEITLWGELC